MILSLIAAASENNVIGRENRLIWKMAQDTAFFMHTTLHHTVIMGRKTYDSMGKGLKNRKNVVISRDAGLRLKDAECFSSLEVALQSLHTRENEELFVIGGAQIYRMALPLARRIYLTRVHAVLEGDAFFPELPHDEWEEIYHSDKPSGPRNEYAASYLIYERLKR